LLRGLGLGTCPGLFSGFEFRFRFSLGSRLFLRLRSCLGRGGSPRFFRGFRRSGGPCFLRGFGLRCRPESRFFGSLGLGACPGIFCGFEFRLRVSLGSRL
jgi:hypothetical protein